MADKQISVDGLEMAEVSGGRQGDHAFLRPEPVLSHQETHGHKYLPGIGGECIGCIGREVLKCDPSVKGAGEPELGVIPAECAECLGRVMDPAQMRAEKIAQDRAFDRPESPRGDPRFHALLKEIGDLHDRKQRDYGTDADPFANVRASAEWGVPSWIGALVRLNDKVHRLKRFAQKRVLANESAEDSMLDVAVYALIALILYREDAATSGKPKSLNELRHVSG